MDADNGAAERLGRGSSARAWIVIVGFVGATAACLAVALTKDTTAPIVPPPGATTDLDYYRLVVDRVRRGESYYDAARAELRAHGYPTRSVFNWRTPVYAWLLGSATGLAWGRGALAAIAFAVVVMFGRDLARDFGPVPATVGVLFLIGATVWSVGGQAFLFMELWAGVLIAFSIAAYRRGWTAPGLASGLFAVFYRELALPYALVSAGLALRAGRKREAWAWALGLALFVGFMGWHARQVHARIGPSDVALPGGWVRFGGIRFLLATARANVALMPLPLWCTALYLPLAALGLGFWRGESGRRAGLTAGLFLAAFSIVGNPFNFYWGFLDAPLLAVGIAGAPSALAELVRAAFHVPGCAATTPARVEGRASREGVWVGPAGVREGIVDTMAIDPRTRRAPMTTFRRTILPWGATALLLAFCLAPKSYLPGGGEESVKRRIHHLDKVVHFGMFAGFTLCWICAGPTPTPTRSRAAVVLGLAFTLAVGTELVQGLPRINRDPDVFDGLADAVGAIACVAAAATWGARRRSIEVE